MTKLLTALALPLVLAAAPALAQSPAVALDDLDCTVRVMKVLSGTLNELKKTDLSADNRTQSERLRSRSERALAYFIGRLDMGPKNPKLAADIATRWSAASSLSVDDQTTQTMQCLARADDGQMAFLKTAAGQ